MTFVAPRPGDPDFIGPIQQFPVLDAAPDLAVELAELGGALGREVGRVMAVCGSMGYRAGVQAALDRVSPMSCTCGHLIRDLLVGQFGSLADRMWADAQTGPAKP